jgi:hypothetical protein
MKKPAGEIVGAVQFKCKSKIETFPISHEVSRVR